MKQSRLQVFDPPMCCSSGVCGPNVDPELVRFSQDLDWLRKQGVDVERFNLASHPAAFAQQECVREALSKEGGNCLPLILVDGSIISRGTYPSRSTLMEITRIHEAVREERSEDTPTTASPRDPKSDPALCGPGCDCSATPAGRGMKMAISLLVLVAVVGVLLYKAWSAKQTASNDTATGGASAFAVGQAAPEAVSGTAAQPKGPNGAGAQVSNATGKIGDYLESLSDLNKVAQSQDAVFIFLPSAKNESVQDRTNAAVLAAQKTLKTNNITLGLYTLRAGSPDYPTISRQVQTPAILVASKGKGMAAVSGDVTETKLLQAFVASSSAGGCGPSGCGPSDCGPSSAGGK